MKKSKHPCQPRRPGKAGLVIVSLLLVLLLLINFVCIVIVPGIVPPVVSVVSAFLGSRITVGESTQTVSAASAAITQEVESEGIVLLENNGTLPIQEGSAINLFGYATNEVMYGGSGSGSGDSTNNVDLVHGLENAGFQVNQELVSFYQKRAVARDSSGFLGNDYSINEIARSEYSNDLIQNAKNFSDIAVVSFSRAGGEGDDLPMDMTNYTGGDAGKHYLTLQQIEIDLLNMNYYSTDAIKNYLALGIHRPLVAEQLHQNSSERKVYLLDSSGRVLISSDGFLELEPMTDILPDWESLLLGEIQRQTAGDSDLLCLRTELDMGMALVMTIDRDSLLRSVRSIPLRTLAVFTVLSLAAYVVVFLYSRSQHRRLHQIIRATEQIGDGDFSGGVLPDLGQDELGQIAGAVNQMNSHIDQLIQENYKRQLMVKSSEVNLLQEQIKVYQWPPPDAPGFC